MTDLVNIKYISLFFANGRKKKIKTIFDIPGDFTGIAEHANGEKYWFKEGRYHREDGPAVEKPDGARQWFKEGRWHREDGPACEYSNGYKEWLIEGNLHRLDGPAVEWAGTDNLWWFEANGHRNQGTVVVEKSNGRKEWWLEGKEYNPINLNDFIVLNYDKGQYGLMWYKLLSKDNVFEYPDIPGLINKE